ncbi:hypothetical protein HK102_008110, partial [Quaeritorhiza haematococci]
MADEEEHVIDEGGEGGEGPDGDVDEKAQDDGSKSRSSSKPKADPEDQPQRSVPQNRNASTRNNTDALKGLGITPILTKTSPSRPNSPGPTSSTLQEPIQAGPSPSAPSAPSAPATTTTTTNNNTNDPGTAAHIKSPIKKKRNTHIVPTSGAFVPFRSGKTELNAGILHLYRDKQEVETLLMNARRRVSSRVEEEGSDGDGTSEEEGGNNPELSEEELRSIKGTGTVLAVLAVPSYMTTQDFLHFVGPVRKSVSHFRIVKDSFPNRYMVLMKFRDTRSADLFYRQFNGRQFNSLEPEECHVVYVKSIEFKSQAIPPYAFPPIPDESNALFFSTKGTGGGNARSGGGSNNLGGSPASAVSGSSSSPSGITPVSAASTSATDSSPSPASASAVSPPTNQLIELPTCPVCLDRMDASVTGLLTILCHHTFHCNCLAKWGDSSCPVCRYSQKASLTHSTHSNPHSDPDLDEDSRNECGECGATENLWICLICGNIGCGRYQQAHAYTHFEGTSHLYALELETQRVWDYAGDNYVHRLIQNKADGKLVELPAPA